MMKFILPLFACLFLINVSSSYYWPPKSVAILVAGSSDFYNYRHQADVAHAYKNLRRHGVKEDDIIVMMYDDVARDYYNIAYNTLFNRPYSENEYTNFHVDYRYDDVTTDVFYSVLKGDVEDLRYKGSGKFVDVNPQDNVFIYLTDHGATGIFGFPGYDDYLFADELVDALKQLKTRCNKIFLFMEACESGSMFQGYLDDVEGIVVITASNPYESSYAYYYVDYLYNYLGDESSINFLEFMEKADPKENTLDDLLNVVRTETKLSHVQVYGDTRMLKMTLDKFFGKKHEYDYDSKKVDSFWSTLDKKQSNDFNAPIAVESKYVQRTLANVKLEHHPDDREALKLIRTEEKIERLFELIQQSFPDVYEDNKNTKLTFTGPVFTSDIKQCYIESIRQFEKKCYHAKEYNLIYSYFNTFYTLCAKDVNKDEILSVIDALCFRPME